MPVNVILNGACGMKDPWGHTRETTLLVFRKDGYRSAIAIGIGIVIASRFIGGPLADDIIDDKGHRLNI